MRIIYIIAGETKVCETNFIRQTIRERKTMFNIYTCEVLRVDIGCYNGSELDFDIEHKESEKLLEEAYKTGILDLRNYKVI
mgnify:CR=1 FL=1